MDALRARLIITLEGLSADLAAGTPLPRCLRRLPRADYQALCAPLLPAAPQRWPRVGAVRARDEPLMLARIALAAGAEAPDELAQALSRLASDLRAAPV